MINYSGIQYQNLTIQPITPNGQTSNRTLTPKITTQTQYFRGQYLQPSNIQQYYQQSRQTQSQYQQQSQQPQLQQQQYSLIEKSASPTIQIQKKQQNTNSNSKLAQKMTFLISEVDRLTLTVDELLKENEEWREKYEKVQNQLQQLEISKQEQISEAIKNYDILQKSISPNKSIKATSLKQDITSEFLATEFEEEFQQLKQENQQLKEQLQLTEENLEQSKQHQIENNEKLLQAVENYQSDAITWKQKAEALEELIGEMQQQDDKENNYEIDFKEFQNQLDSSEQQKQELQVKISKLKKQVDLLDAEKKELEKDMNLKIGVLTKKNTQLQQKLLSNQNKAAINIDLKTEKIYQDQILKLTEELEALNDENQLLITDNQSFLEKNTELEEKLSMIQKFKSEIQIEKNIPIINPQIHAQSQSQTPQHFLNQNIEVQQNDDYLVRQLRKFQEINQSNLQSKKIGKKDLAKKNSKKISKK